jgi:uncharacterized protein YjbI with pentapeptide repeats
MMSGFWIFAIAIALGAVFLIVCYTIPQQFAKIDIQTTPRDRADVEDAYRKTLAQALGGFALVVTFAWTFLKDGETLDQARQQLANQQFVEGAKLLKEDNIGTSAAGVHALGQVAITRPEFQSAVVDSLVSFIKSGKALKSHDQIAVPDGAPGTIPANIQAAVSVLATRNQSSGEQIDLYGAYLVRAKFSVAEEKKRAAFSSANFQGATLYGAVFHDLDLSNAAFDGSRMSDWEAFSTWTAGTPTESAYIDAKHLFTVNFEGAKLINAGFDNVWMGGANLRSTNLKGAGFWKADLSRADLTKAIIGPTDPKQGTHFNDATLTDSIFAETDLEGVRFVKAKLHGTDFRGAKNVDKADFTDACSDREPLYDQAVRRTFGALPRC